MSPEMQSNLDIVCSQITKTFGKGSIMKLTDKANVDPESVISTSSISLDIALGVGGYQRGRIVEIFGKESVGKSTLCLHAIVNAQKKGVSCAFIDSEHALDKNYAEALGVNIDTLLFSQPDFGEQAFGIIDMLVRSGEVGLIVVDSVAALVPQKELEGEIGDSHMGLHARLMSQALRMLVGKCEKTNCSIIFTNQIRQKIGVVYGSPNTVTGGNSLKFYASQRLEISRIGDIKEKEAVVGNLTKVKVVKNKLAPPKKEATFSIMFGKGIDPYLETLQLASEDGLVQKSGAWYKYNNASVAQGEAAALRWIKDNEEVYQAIRNELLEARGLK